VGGAIYVVDERRLLADSGASERTARDPLLHFLLLAHNGIMFYEPHECIHTAKDVNASAET
jgi:hypothetical protein